MQPVPVAQLRRGGGYHQVTVPVEASDSEIRFDAAALIQPLGINDAAGWHGYVIGADPIKLSFGIDPLDEEFSERALIEERHPLARRPVLASAVLEPVLPGIRIL